MLQLFENFRNVFNKKIKATNTDYNRIISIYDYLKSLSEAELKRRCKLKKLPLWDCHYSFETNDLENIEFDISFDFIDDHHSTINFAIFEPIGGGCVTHYFLRARKSAECGIMSPASVEKEQKLRTVLSELENYLGVETLNEG